MSRLTKLANGPKKIAAWVIALAAALFIEISLAPTTGAVFTDEENGTYSADTGDVNVDLADENTNVDLTFNNLGTGVAKAKSDSFTVTNSGSLKMTASLCDATVDTAPAVTGEEDKLKVRVKVNGSVVQDWMSASDLSAEINLGTFNAGAAKTVTVEVYLDETATNAWANQTMAGSFTACAVEV
jgi:hypothetical protein